MGSPRLVHGDDLLYRFFQTTLAREPDLMAKVPNLLIQTLAVWFPVSVYQRFPVLLPWVVRDPTCRGNPKVGLPDAWSAPDCDGFLRDDNSLVKSLPRSLTIRGPKDARLDGARLGGEFVASHIWRRTYGPELASRNPLLNTFVPNLVWLPRQISKLSDREDGPIQSALKAWSHAIYRDADVLLDLRPVVEDAWSLLPSSPAAQPRQRALLELNWFEESAVFFAKRRARLDEVLGALEAVCLGHPLAKKVIASRYTAGLPTLDPARCRSTLTFLGRFHAAG